MFGKNKKSKKHRILHGLIEVAGQAYYSVLGLRHLGAKADLVTWQRNSFGYPHDILLNIDINKTQLLPWYACKTGVFLIYALLKYDVFHFHFGKSICWNYNLKIFRLLRKQVVFEYHGSEIRNGALKYEIEGNVHFKEKHISKKMLKMNMSICKKADKLIFHDDELINHLPIPFEKVYVVPLRLDIQKFVPIYPDLTKKTVRIVHAPSSRSNKGTFYILRAIEQLKMRYDIDFVLVENKPQEQAKEIYNSADIIVDQLIIGTYGVFSVEGMSLGKPVVCFISDFMKETLPKELPIVSANLDDISNRLEELIKSPELRYNLGVAGRNYVETYHDYRINAQMLQKIYRGELEPIQGREAFEQIKLLKQTIYEKGE